jgi:hypothetical protein
MGQFPTRACQHLVSPNSAGCSPGIFSCVLDQPSPSQTIKIPSSPTPRPEQFFGRTLGGLLPWRRGMRTYVLAGPV